jgi:Fe2+ transport system protein B
MTFFQDFISEINLKIPEKINPITGENLEKLTQKTQELKTTFHNLKQQSLDNISQYKEELTNITREKTESFQNNLTETTNHLTNRITIVTEKSKNSLNETIQKAENLKHDLSEKINISLDGIFDSWIQEHPLLNWLFSHPIFGIMIGLICLLILFSLSQAIFEIFKQLMVALLRTPWLISKFVFLKSVNEPLQNNYYNGQNNVNILQKLDEIERKQQAILEQLSKFNSKK